MSSPDFEPPEELRRRRKAARRAGRNRNRSEIDQRRRRVSPGLGRRRRYQAAGLLAVLFVILAIVLVGNLGDGNSGGSRAKTQTVADHARAARDAHNHGKSTSGGASSTTTTGTAGASTGAGTGTGPGKIAVPILMYHVIAAPPPGASFPGLYVVPSEFAAQMEALKRAGWHAVTLDQVQAYWLHGASLGAGKPIVVSFDNGYQSQYTQALPVLRQLGWVADENVQLTGLPPSQGGLSQAQVKGLVAAGWELDTQGFSHADLITLDSEELHYQVAVARSTVQQRYGVPVNWFCYPSGHYDATVIAAVKAAGYTGSTTVVPGWAHPAEDRYRLHRLRVLGETSPETLLSELAGIRDDPPAPSSYNGA